MGLDVLDASDGLHRTPSSSTWISTFRHGLHRHPEYTVNFVFTGMSELKIPRGKSLRAQPRSLLDLGGFDGQISRLGIRDSLARNDVLDSGILSSA